MFLQEQIKDIIITLVWRVAHPSPSASKRWTSDEEAWLAKHVPADVALRYKHLNGVARAFEDEFKYKRTAHSLRRKIECMREQVLKASKESWLACLQPSSSL